MALITVFTVPKPFTDPHISIIQHNTIRNLTHLGSDVEALLIGDEVGAAEAAAATGVRYLPDVARNTSGTPLVSSVFALARQASDSPVLAYINADILLLPDFVEGVREVFAGAALGGRPAERILLVGRRWNLDVMEALDFSQGWDGRLRTEVLARGKLQSPHGSDHFIFPRTAYTDIPDFAIGRSGWDNWMIYHAIQQGWVVADTTPSMLVIHQNHDYHHLPGGQIHHRQAESVQNVNLGGGKSHMYLLLDVGKVLVDGKIRRAPLSRARLLRQLEFLFMPKDGDPTGWRWRVICQLRRLRSHRKRVPGS